MSSLTLMLSATLHWMCCRICPTPCQNKLKLMPYFTRIIKVDRWLDLSPRPQHLSKAAATYPKSSYWKWTYGSILKPNEELLAKAILSL